MLPNPPPEALTALQFIRRGRFLDAVAILGRWAPENGSVARRTDPVTLSVLADALQRAGENDRAEAIASYTLQTTANTAQAKARCHFVLGNVFRDRGATAKAIEHLQIAADLGSSDPEFNCWTQVRLIVVLSELSGAQTAMARIDGVKRALTSYGDPRPFAALHLWLVEVESLRGNVESARQHLKTAERLLANVDDVWLRGYLAINRSAVHYYSAEITEAREWAAIATKCAEASGHRATLRAAHTNLGNIEFSLGHHVAAEECFELALKCCEPGSVHRIAILDNIAQIRLHRGDTDGCRSLVSRLETLIEHNNHVKRRHYNACALQTKIRLLLRQGKNTEALIATARISEVLKGLSPARIATQTHLLNAEVLLANGRPIEAAETLGVVFSSTTPLSPDLFAKFEHISGRVLASSGSMDLARVHLERAAHVFGTIGHFLGKEESLRDLSVLRESRDPNITRERESPRPLDRIRALIELRSRPELFGHEAASLLKELSCTSIVELSVHDGPSEGEVVRELNGSSPLPVDRLMSIAFNAGSNRTVTLSFAPLNDPEAQLTSLSFYRVIEQILAIRSSEPTLTEQEIVWAGDEGKSAQPGVIFGSNSMRVILRTIKQVSPIDVSVLITGETGTGKEVIARAIHEHSHRSSMPFLALNCAAVSKELLESQLFGHRKGAFSGATENHQGIVRAANGGTLFLDEIGELPLDMQAKLLRFLEMGEVHPVGDNHPVKVNVRLLFATNGDLEEAVRQNRFRQDLFYRLNVIPIKVPPLRERREEIPVLANVFAQRFAGEFAKEPVRFSDSAMELLILYSWPGNIRQLANEIRRLAALAESGACITPDELSPPLQALSVRANAEGDKGTSRMQVRIDQSLEQATAYLETEMIKHALRQAGGRVAAAASTLGISRKGLYLKRLRLGLMDYES